MIRDHPPPSGDRAEGEGQMTIEDRRSTAIHEAAHVVVAWALDLPVGSMQIGCNGDDTAGRSEIDESARQLSLIDRIALCIAGVQATTLAGQGGRLQLSRIPICCS